MMGSSPEISSHESQLNDIALLRVNGKMEFGDKVTPVNLPSPSLDVEECRTRLYFSLE